MVASSDEEIADDKQRFDVQNLGAVMHDLLRNPEQSPREMANDFVAAANRADTLASMDMAQYSQFQQRLNEFGSALNH